MASSPTRAPRGSVSRAHSGSSSLATPSDQVGSPSPGLFPVAATSHLFLLCIAIIRHTIMRRDRCPSALVSLSSTGRQAGEVGEAREGFEGRGAVLVCVCVGGGGGGLPLHPALRREGFLSTSIVITHLPSHLRPTFLHPPPEKKSRASLWPSCSLQLSDHLNSNTRVIGPDCSMSMFPALQPLWSR